MARYTFTQGGRTQVLLCKDENCLSDNIQLVNRKKDQGIGADFHIVHIICNKCGKPNQYTWTNEVQIRQEDI